MTAKERVTRAIELEGPDRVPHQKRDYQKSRLSEEGSQKKQESQYGDRDTDWRTDDGE